MKKLFVLFLFIAVCSQICAQQTPFVRVLDKQGSNLNRGRVYAATDSSLQLDHAGGIISVPVNEIGAIKLGRSAGQNVWIGALTGGVVLGLITASDGGGSEASSGYGVTFSRSEAGAIGAFVGLPIGAAAGGITALFKKSKVFIIDGSLEQWKEFQTFLATESKRQIKSKETLLIQNEQ